jgi:L-fuconolactonase
MTAPARIVDAHVHFWDPARTDWYPYLSGRQQLDLGDVTGMARRFDPETYLAEAAGWAVVKVVNVAAATGPQSVEETLELDDRAGASGHPAAIVGGITPGSVQEIEAQLDRQLEAERFRGVRPMGAFEHPVPAPDVLRALAERGLVLDLMAHPHQLRSAAEALAGHDDLTVVVEHTGWPRDGSPEERSLWDDGLAALADLGERVACKLSGLAMPLRSMDAAVLAPWVETAIEHFGVQRCMFASNFPVDGMHGTLDQLFTAYAAITAGLDDDARDSLFAATAERVYRC